MQFVDANMEGHHMRKIFLVICVALCASLFVVGTLSNVSAGDIDQAAGNSGSALARATPLAHGEYRSDGTYTGTPNEQVVALFAQFPNGGQALSDAITALLIANPELASDVIYVASKGTVQQQLAAGTGLAAALPQLRAEGNTSAVAQITQTMQISALTTTTSIMTSFSSAQLSPVTRIPVCLTTTDNTVSPSRPVTTCQ
jgi:hypothetical protein